MKLKNASFIILSLLTTPVYSADFYVDPERGDAANEGSFAKPWHSLQEVLDRGWVETRTWDSLPHTDGSKLVMKNPGAPIKAGDTIWLKSGDHGALRIGDMYNSGVITIAALEGHRPTFQSILLRSGSHWAFRGLHVRAKPESGKKPGALVAIESHGFKGPVHDVWVENCVLSSADDTSSWSAEDWNERAYSGIRAEGTRITLRGNHLKNVNFGLSVSASFSLIESNTVENFSGDGMRGQGNYSVFQYNVVKNCYDVNDNHDDGFQSWSRGPKGDVGRGSVKGLVLRGNTIINYEDPAQPHRGALQGIGCFDGMYVDWVIENNVVIVDHWHGITLLGATNCRIVNNTVIDRSTGRPGPPWIKIGDHKTGKVSSGCIVRNNITTDLQVRKGTTVDHNLIVKDEAAVFTDALKCDLTLVRGSPAIDAGTQDLAPERDIVGKWRPQGKSVDLGAYEFTEDE